MKTRIGIKWYISKCLFGHNIIEIFPGNLLSILGGALEHFGEFVIGHGFAELFGDLAQVGEVDSVAAILVKKVEYLVDAFLGFLD